MRDIPTYKCLKCGDIIGSSPIWHQMNWCSCRSVGVDDHAKGNRVGISGNSENMAFLKDGVFINCSEIQESEINDDMKQDMESIDLYSRHPNEKAYESICGCGVDHTAKYYRDECHEYGGSWWWSHCLIKHLLNKYEGGSDDEKPPR
jgi:hypothetical protein